VATAQLSEKTGGSTPPTGTDASRKRGKLKSILLSLLLGFVALLAILCIVIAMQPEDFRVSRSMTMNAPPDRVFAEVNDFHRWEAWSPWAKLDPNAKETYEGPSSGVGSIFRWDGDANVGAGNMTIVESKPNERIGIKLEFIRPFAGLCGTEFTFKPEGDGTTMTWTMSGKNNFIAKAIGLLLIDCDKMMGTEFEKGLTSIKSIVEQPPNG